MYFIGIDVSKKTLHSMLLLDPATEKNRTKAIPNTAEGFATLVAWGTKFGHCDPQDLHIILEATGVYHEGVAEALYQAGCRVSIVNPLHVKRFAQSRGVRTKNDDHDRLILARFGDERQPPAWVPPPPEIKQLKALLARLHAIESDIQRELNRLEKAEVAKAPDSVTQSIGTMLTSLREEQRRLQRQVDDHIDRHPGLKKDNALLRSIPGIGNKLAPLLLVLLRGKTFRDARQAAAFLGLVPIEFQSGTTVFKRPRLSKAGDARYRAALYFPAIVAIRHNPDVAALYQRLLSNGKSKMAAIGAAMRKLVHIAYGVIKHQTPFQPQMA